MHRRRHRPPAIWRWRTGSELSQTAVWEAVICLLLHCASCRRQLASPATPQPPHAIRRLQNDAFYLPPNADYRTFYSGAELQQILLRSQPAGKYLRMDEGTPIMVVSGGGLEAAAYTTTTIDCGGNTLDLQCIEGTQINADTTLNFYNCSFLGPDSSAAWAHRAVFYNSRIIHPCEAVDPQVSILAQSLRGTDVHFERLDVNVPPNHSASWINSNATCLSRDELKDDTGFKHCSQKPGAASSAGGSGGGMEGWVIAVIVIALTLFLALLVLLALLCKQRSRFKRQGPFPSNLDSKALPPGASELHRDTFETNSVLPPGSAQKSPRLSNIRGSQERASSDIPNPSPRIFPSHKSLSMDTDSRLPVEIENALPSAATSSQHKSGAGSEASSIVSPGRLPPQMHSLEQHLDILDLVGSGGYGRVYRGIWKGLEVAVKTVLFQDREVEGGGLNSVERVFAEAAIACNMSHPAVVNTFAHELKRMPHSSSGKLVDYKLYLVQEFCSGGSLAKLSMGGHLRTSAGGVHIDRILTILDFVASGMSHMHSQRMVHGDLNPSNVMLQPLRHRSRSQPISRKRFHPKVAEAAQGLDTGDTHVKLTDFGLSIQLGYGITHVSNVKQGTPFYTAPELATLHRLSPASDVYSFGVIMWELFMNDRPFRVRDGKFAPNLDFGKFPPFTPLNYALLAAACLSADTHERPSFEQVLEVLEAIKGEMASGRYTDLCGLKQTTALLTRKTDSTAITLPSIAKARRKPRALAAMAPLFSPVNSSLYSAQNVAQPLGSQQLRALPSAKDGAAAGGGAGAGALQNGTADATPAPSVQRAWPRDRESIEASTARNGSMRGSISDVQRPAREIPNREIVPCAVADETATLTTATTGTRRSAQPVHGDSLADRSPSLHRSVDGRAEVELTSGMRPGLSVNVMGLLKDSQAWGTKRVQSRAERGRSYEAPKEARRLQSRGDRSRSHDCSHEVSAGAAGVARPARKELTDVR